MQFELKQALLVAIPSIISFLGGYFIYKLKNSIIKLQRRVSIQTLANSYNDDFWGDIQILHNQAPINHLHFVKADIINSAKKDIDAFTIQLTAGSANKILSAHAMNMDTRVEINETQAYRQQMEIQNWEYLNTHREYEAKVLNRGTRISINLLVESQNLQLSDDEIIIAVEKPGVRLVPYRTVTSNQIGMWGILLGMLAVAGTAFGCYVWYPEAKIPITVLGIVGAANIFIGVIIYYSIIGWRHWRDDEDDDA